MRAAPFTTSRHDGADAEVLRQLELDLPRTAGSDVALHGVIGRVRGMILQHLEDDRELGYCQGMTLVATVFAAHSAEKEAYERFAGFMRRVRGLWLPGFPMLQPSINSFEVLAASKPWFTHLKRYGVQTEMFLPQALLSMLATWLPLRALLYCLDFVETGVEPLLALAVAVLDLQEPRILKQESFEELMDVVQGLKDQEVSCSRLLQAAEENLARVVDLGSVSTQPWRSQKLHRKGSKVVDEEGVEILAASAGGLPDNLEWLAQEKDGTQPWWPNMGSLFHWIFPDCEAGKEQKSTLQSM